MVTWEPTDKQVGQVAAEMVEHFEGASYVNPITIALKAPFVKEVLIKMYESFPYVINGLLKNN